MGRQKKYSDKQIIEALQLSDGVVSRAAQILGTIDSTIHQRIKRTPEIAEAINQCREKIVDSAETGLFAAVQARKPWAIKFALSRLGRHRGYGNSLQVETSHTGRIVLLLPDDGRGDDPNRINKDIDGTAGATVRGIPEQG